MFENFTDEIEMQIKSGMANLYWYKSDLKGAWIRSGISHELCNLLFGKRNDDNQELSKRELMDLLYYEMRKLEHTTRNKYLGILLKFCLIIKILYLVTRNIELKLPKIVLED